jgi:predicted AAA+ superfamily ATPase
LRVRVRPVKGLGANRNVNAMSKTASELDLARFAATLERVAAALERLAPPPPAKPLFETADAFVWHPEGRRLAPVERVNRVDMSLLMGIDRVRDLLTENTERFARGLPANNALLWGARGMGKSSLVKAAHAAVSAG